MRQTYIELENSNIIPQDRETTQNHRQNNQQEEELYLLETLVVFFVCVVSLSYGIMLLFSSST